RRQLGRQFGGAALFQRLGGDDIDGSDRVQAGAVGDAGAGDHDVVHRGGAAGRVLGLGGARAGDQKDGAGRGGQKGGATERGDGHGRDQLFWFDAGNAPHTESATVQACVGKTNEKFPGGEISPIGDRERPANAAPGSGGAGLKAWRL